MSTIDYYNRHADRFFRESFDLDMEELYAAFLSLVPAGGDILDAGCGSGRDSLFFSRRGYRVTAFDASEQLAVLSARLTGLPVLRLTFQQIDFEGEFDGVWACASLLHVPRGEMDDVLARLASALKPGGVMYASFKYGDGEWEQGGRFFNSYDEGSFAALTRQHPSLTLHRQWQSEDVRPGREKQLWFNALLRKV